MRDVLAKFITIFNMFAIKICSCVALGSLPVETLKIQIKENKNLNIKVSFRSLILFAIRSTRFEIQRAFGQILIYVSPLKLAYLLLVNPNEIYSLSFIF